MPELPEVEVVRRGLAAHAVGRRIVTVAALHPRSVRRQAGGADEMAALLTGREVVGTGRRGKFLWLLTDDAHLALAAHLGMSGQFRVDPPGGAVPGHARASFDLDDSVLWFIDQRTFGWVSAAELVPDASGAAVPLMVRGIALDPTEADFDAAVVARAMRSHRVELKRLLLDQSLVSGIGNIYADEALWRAGVHPRRRADRLPAATVRLVLAQASAVMAESLAAGGTSFDALYVDVNGRSGYFERGLAVYGRHGRPCRRCGTPVARERFANRHSHFCPHCQPAPRATA